MCAFTAARTGRCANSSQFKYRVELPVLQTRDTDQVVKHMKVLRFHAGVSPASIDQIMFTNTGSTAQQLCVDNMQLLDGNAAS